MSAKDAEQELEKTNQNASSVEEQTPSQETEQPQFQLIEVPKISKKTRAMAKSVGIDLDGIVNGLDTFNRWAASVEHRMQIIVQKMPTSAKIKDAMNEWVAEQQKMLQKNMPAMPQTQGQGNLGALGQLAGLLPYVMGGGGSDSEMAALTKEMFKMNLETMKADIGFTKALKNAMLSKYASEAVKSVAP